LTGAGLDVRADTMEEELAGETFRIRTSSFFQTNTVQAEKMVSLVLQGLLEESEPHHVGAQFIAPLHDGVRPFGNSKHPLTIVDAYCGVGTFSLLMARHVEQVIAIEESPSAIQDAQWNLRDVGNVEILKGKVEDLLPSLSSHIDGLVIDPPRAGCQQVVLDALILHRVARIVYVSCDPETLARDLNILCHLQPAYRLRSVQPLDMFPQTAHIECVTVLESI
jgi:23S rRNA (uracil1939-C5)-methyltransferase